MKPKTFVKTLLVLTSITLMLGNLSAQSLLSGPQKIVIDSKRNRYLVSNFNTGDIIQIDSAGNQDYFVQGADFVDGLEIVGDTVYGVGYNRIVHAYDLESGQLVLDVPFAGSNSYYLSSITSDSAGHLFISCPALHTIYKMRISDGAYWIFAANNGLNRPNGILLEKENDRIVVIDDSPGTSIIHAISLSDSSVSDLMTNVLHYPDGITRDKYGYYYVGGYYLPGLYMINPDFSGEPDLFFEGSHMIYPTYHEEHHSLLVTYYGSNGWDEVFLTTTSVTPNNMLGGPVLFHNYPNPFCSKTFFRIDNADEVNTVKIEIYDLQGQLLKQIQYNSNQYEMNWDGSNQKGEQVKSGIYICKYSISDKSGSFKICKME